MKNQTDVNRKFICTSNVRPFGDWNIYLYKKNGIQTYSAESNDELFKDVHPFSPSRPGLLEEIKYKASAQYIHANQLANTGCSPLSMEKEIEELFKAIKEYEDAIADHETLGRYGVLDKHGSDSSEAIAGRKAAIQLAAFKFLENNPIPTDI